MNKLQYFLITNVIYSLVLATSLTYILLGKSVIFFCLSFFIGFLISSIKVLHLIGYGISFLIFFTLPSAKTSHGKILSQGIIDTIMTTNANESLEFFISLPSQHIFLGIICSLVLISSLFFSRTNLNHSLKIAVGLIITVFFVLAYNKVFLPKVLPLIQAYSKLNTQNLPQPTWKITGTKNLPFDNYVLVIGESLRSDMMSLYGCPFPTTPYLEKLPKQYITNYVSTAINTSLSVPRILALSNKEQVLEQENVIQLAKQANLDTYWISAQGYSGRFDVTTSRIAKVADNLYFQPKDDMEMLPILKKIISKKQKKFIILHMHGSHEHPCNKLKKDEKIFKTGGGKFLDCYLSTVRKTDVFLKEVVSILRANNQSYTLIFQSDHAQNHIFDKNKGIAVLRDDKVKQSFLIPFFITNSNMVKTEKIDVTRSAYHFVDYFPTWLGTQSNKTIPDYSITNLSNDRALVMNYRNKLEPLSTKKDALTADQILRNIEIK